MPFPGISGVQLCIAASDLRALSPQSQGPAHKVAKHWYFWVQPTAWYQAQCHPYCRKATTQVWLSVDSPF